MFLQACSWLEHNSAMIDINRSVLVSLMVYVIHYFSMFLVVGSMVIVDLGVLGALGQHRGIGEIAEQVWPVMWVALGLVVISGFIMFSPDATAYYAGPSFRLKLLVTLLAVVLSILVQWKIPKWDRLPSIPTGGKLLALVSLILWVGTILASVEVATVFQNPA